MGPRRHGVFDVRRRQSAVGGGARGQCAARGGVGQRVRRCGAWTISRPADGCACWCRRRGWRWRRTRRRGGGCARSRRSSGWCTSATCSRACTRRRRCSSRGASRMARRARAQMVETPRGPVAQAELMRDPACALNARLTPAERALAHEARRSSRAAGRARALHSRRGHRRQSADARPGAKRRGRRADCRRARCGADAHRRAAAAAVRAADPRAAGGAAGGVRARQGRLSLRVEPPGGGGRSPGAADAQQRQRVRRRR